MLRAVQSEMVSMGRIVGAKPWMPGELRPTDAKTKEALLVPSADALVDLARLRHAGWLATAAVPALRALLKGSGSLAWRGEVLDAAIANVVGYTAGRTGSPAGWTQYRGQGHGDGWKQEQCKCTNLSQMARGGQDSTSIPNCRAQRQGGKLEAFSVEALAETDSKDRGTLAAQQTQGVNTYMLDRPQEKREPWIKRRSHPEELNLHRCWLCSSRTKQESCMVISDDMCAHGFAQAL